MAPSLHSFQFLYDRWLGTVQLDTEVPRIILDPTSSILNLNFPIFNPQYPNTLSSILEPESLMHRPGSSIINPQSSKLNHLSSILNYKFYKFNPQYSIVYPQSSILNQFPQSSFFNPKSLISYLNSQSIILNLHSAMLNVNFLNWICIIPRFRAQVPAVSSCLGPNMPILKLA